jgi:hypothetical protein
MNNIYAEIEGRISENGLIRNFPEVIKSIIIDEAGFLPGNLPESALNLNSFDSAGNSLNGTRKDWKCDTIIERIYSKKLISQLLNESALILIPDYLGLEKLITLDEISTTVTLTMNDILADSKGMPEISISQTGMDIMKNSFIIQYYYDYFTGKYLKSEFLNKDDSSLSALENSRTGIPDTYTGLCLESFNRYGKNYEYTIEARHIRDRETAIMLMKWYAVWFSKRRIIINLTCALNSNTISLETGDQVKADMDLLPAGARNSHNFIITGIKTDYWNGTIDMNLLELSEPE